LVIYQNSTVGKNYGVAPVIEEEVILFPHAAIIGRSLVRSGSIVSQGVSVINKETKFNKIVFNGRDGNLVFKDKKRVIIDDYFIF
jgi:serine O-acetyltransferase